MTEAIAPPAPKPGWRFPRTFWVANGAELFERAAYYGMFIALATYLTDRVGFSDVAAGLLAGSFSSVLYLLPMFMGAMADKIGFRRALLLAFGLLTIGYFLLGAFQLKNMVVLSLLLIMFGGAIVKPVISGTTVKCSDEVNRARAFSIFYLMINIGAFLGKTVARPLRMAAFTVPGTTWHIQFRLGDINFYAALMAFCAFVLVALLYRNVGGGGSNKSVREVLAGFREIVRNFRFMGLILIVAGFWAIQVQLYASMPKYMLRLVGPHASPEWLANINPFVVVFLVVPITHLVRRWRPVRSIGVALLLASLLPIALSLEPLLEAQAGSPIVLFGIALHPITLAAAVGIAFVGLGECFLSPKFYEFASMQAPKDQVGLYMGYQNLTTFFAWSFGFGSSGVLLKWFCPDPKTLSVDAYAQWQAAATTQPTAALPVEYAHAHYLWYAYALVGAVALLALVAFKAATDRRDARRGTEGSRDPGIEESRDQGIKATAEPR